MGCASAKHVSTVQNEEETQKGKNYQNGDVFGGKWCGILPFSNITNGLEGILGSLNLSQNRKGNVRLNHDNNALGPFKG